MTTTTPLRRTFPLDHRPLNVLAIASLIGVAFAGVLYFVDPRELLGVPLWEKPLKFLLSTVAYSVTFSWFYGLITRGRRTVWWLGSIMAAMLVLELVIIIGLASVGLTSHFNVSSGFQIAMWSIMASGISTLWVVTFLVGGFLWRADGIEPLLRSGIRWGLATGLAGMGLAFTMTPPQPGQINNWEGIAGAHTVGSADGGPGLPFLGWSIEAGDLRIAHFLGLHGLQVLPVLALVLGIVVSSLSLQQALLHGVAVTYSLLVVVTYIQALLGESIVSPSPEILLGYGLAVVGGALTAVLVFFVSAKRAPDRISAERSRT
jgi:hypothetical protein